MRRITTDYSKNEFWKETDMPVGKTEDFTHLVNVYPELKGHVIQGFGGAFTEASTYNYSRLGEVNKRAVIEGYFGEEGLRYNIGRTHIHSCDFALGNYTYIEEGDTELKSFDIARDRENMIPMIRDAMRESSSRLYFLASPWSPPAFMKTNGDMNHGGKLKEEYYGVWAGYIVRYIQEYEKEGIKISYLTVQNEPMAVQAWDSCIYTPEEEALFLREHLAPALAEASLDHVKIFIWDHNKDEVYDRAKALFASREILDEVAGVAVHWYSGDHFEALEAVKKRFPEKSLFFTEGCVEYSRFADSSEVTKAEMYAHDMIGNLKAGVEAFFDWNLLLDDKGGPNHAGNFCAAPMMCTPEEDTIEKRLSYYYIGHFSRYIKRGARKIETSRYTDKIETVGFLNPDGERVIILLNKSDSAAEVTLRENGLGGQFTLQPHTISTICYGA